MFLRIIMDVLVDYSIYAISPTVLLEKYSDKCEEFTVVDVRTDEERIKSRIIDSIHIPLSEIMRDPAVVSKFLVLVLYCKGDFRSRTALARIVGSAHDSTGRKIFYLVGGIDACAIDCPRLCEF